MRIRRLSVVLTISLAANVALALGWLGQALSEGVLASDTQSSFQLLASEHAELRRMREHFCPENPAPTRAELLAWEASVRPVAQLSEPFDKDGLLWLRAAGVKLDAEERLVGVCLSQAWGLLGDARGDDLDRAGRLCPLEPLC